MSWQCKQDIQQKLKQIEKIMKIDINASLIKRPVERQQLVGACWVGAADDMILTCIWLFLRIELIGGSHIPLREKKNGEWKRR